MSTRVRNFSRLFLGSFVVFGVVSAGFPAFGSAKVAEAVTSVQPVTAKSDGHAESETNAVREASTAGVPVVVDDLTSPTEITKANPDGSLTKEISSEPVRMETSSGWADISTDLVAKNVGGQSVLVPEAVPVDVTLGTKGTSVMATLGDDEGHSITQSWPFGTLPEPVVVGNTATYSAVLPGVDLVQVVHQTGVSQVLKIYSAEAVKDPRVAQMRIALDVKNATLRDEPGGSGLSARAADDGAVVLHTADGQWWDSSQDGASATDPGALV